MALLVQRGTFDAASGIQVVPHAMGSAPKVAIFWTAGRSTALTSPGNHSLLGHGFAAGGPGAIQNAAVGYTSTHSVNPTQIYLFNRSDASVAVAHTGGGIRRRGRVTAFGSSTFTMNWAASDGNGCIIHYLLLGGDDIEAAWVGMITAPASSGSLAYTGPGFQPNLVMAAGTGQSTPDVLNTVVDAYGSVGAAKAAASQFSNGWLDRDGLASSVTALISRAALIGETGANQNVGALTSMDANGFTINWSTLNRPSALYAALALRGPMVAVNSLIAPTTDSDQSVSGLGFQPSAVAIGGTGATDALETQGNPARLGFGIADGNDGSAVSSSAGNSENPSKTAGYQQTSDFLIAMTTAAKSVNEEAGLSSLDADGFTLTWDKQASASANRYWYLALGTNPDQTVFADSILSEEAFGGGTISPAFSPITGGIPSQEKFGKGTISGGVLTAPPPPEPIWRLAFHDLDGSLVGEILNATAREFRFNLNQPSTITFKLDTLNPMLPKIYERTGEGYLLAYQDGILRFTGETQTAELANAPTPDRREPAAQIVATETMWPVLQGRLIGKSRAGYQITDPTDRGSMLFELLHLINFESQSSIYPGFRSVLSTLVGGPWHYKPYLELLLELSATINGFDVDQTPLDPSVDGRTGLLNLYAVKGRERPGALFEFGVGKHNARDYRWMVNRQNLINRGYALPADYPNNATLEVVEAEDATSISARGLREAVISQDLVEADLRQQLVDEHIAVRAAPMQRFFINPAPLSNAPKPFIDYELGDIVEGRVLESGVVLLNGQIRVYGIHIDIDNTGMETVTLVATMEESA